MLKSTDQGTASDSENRSAEPAARATYASASIRARRSRILDEAQHAIGEVGIANLSMEDVAKRAGVAKRTLYNAYRSKERLIAAAIYQYFEDYLGRMTYSTPPATLDRLIERLVVLARRSLKIRPYTRVLMDIYFSRDIEPDIRQAIHDIAVESHGPWIRHLDKKHQLQPWINAEELIDSLVRLRYSLAYAWSEELIEDEAYLTSVIRSVLTFMAGATRGQTRRQVEQALKDLPDLLGSADAD